MAEYGDPATDDWKFLEQYSPYHNVRPGQRYPRAQQRVLGLHRLQLAPAADGALHLRWCDPELGEAARWHLHEWQASGQFRAALAWYPH